MTDITPPEPLTKDMHHILATAMLFYMKRESDRKEARRIFKAIRSLFVRRREQEESESDDD